MAERCTPEIERTKKALVDCYARLGTISEKIDRANMADDLDELERVVTLQLKLIERVEFLKARLRVEASHEFSSIDEQAQHIAEAAGFNLQKHFLTPSYERLI